MRAWVFTILLCQLASCIKEHDASSGGTRLKPVRARIFRVPHEQTSPPKVVVFSASRLKSVPMGEPRVQATPSIKRLLGPMPWKSAAAPSITAAVFSVVNPPVDRPANLSKPKPILAGVPEMVVAKDAFIKEPNPQSFSTFGKLQGLKHQTINCIIQDKSGNLWFGTDGGVSKYDGKFFTHFTEREGLPNNRVRCILEDHSGALWFGTHGGGATRYDGRFFTHYNTTTGLPSNKVVALMQDSRDNIWFGLDEGGAVRYDGQSLKSLSLPQGSTQESVWAMVEDSTGSIWFATGGSGVIKLAGQSLVQYTQQQGLLHDVVYSIAFDAKGTAWFGSQKGVSTFDGKYITTLSQTDGLINSNVFSVISDHRGNMWFATDSGVTQFDGNSLIHYSEKEGLSNNRVLSILEDKTRNLWFGSDVGVCKYDGRTFTHFTAEQGLESSTCRALCTDRKGNLWMGTYGAGAICYNRKSFLGMGEREGLANNIVYSILQDKKGSLWFGTRGGVSRCTGSTVMNITEQEGMLNEIVFCLLEDRKGNIWMGTEHGACAFDGRTLKTYTEQQGLSGNNVRCMYEDRKGNLWFGTLGGGATRFDGKNFEHFTEASGLPGNTVWSIAEDAAGNIWMGTNGGGAVRFDGETLTSFSESEGLTNNYVFNIMPDHLGNLWFGTRFGLSKLSKTKWETLNDFLQEHQTNRTHFITLDKYSALFTNYTHEDGFLGVGINAGKTLCEDHDGVIWIASNDRITAFHPAGEWEQAEIPNTQLTGIGIHQTFLSWPHIAQKPDTTLTLDNGVQLGPIRFRGLSKENNLPQNLSLSFNQNYLTFRFIGITLLHPQKVRYQYKLMGIDAGWSTSTTQTEATYANLPPGSYTFWVRAINSEGASGKPFSYAFEIRPPWWRTWWAFSLYATTGLIAIIAYIRWRERALRKKQKELQEKVNQATLEITMQKNLIEEKHREITDSINYAERIQRSFLATQEHLTEHLHDFFVFFKPKDVVSGDFYWSASLSNGTFALVTADSTGHGVPGAIMSLLNITALEKSIETHTKPADILNATRSIIINRLKKDGSQEGGKDGMDCSIIILDFNRKHLSISAANNPVWIIQTNEQGERHLLEIKPDKMPVGKHTHQHIPFTAHELEWQRGDVIFAFTDGFQDQFGGALGKKFKVKQLRELLLSNAQLPMQDLYKVLQNTFSLWKGELEQVDDVCVIGLRL